MGVGVVPEVVRRTHPWLMGSRVVLCGCVGFGVPVCARVCGWGHAVGFWGGAPWLWPAWPVPLLECGGVWVVVGGLVVICIVDASIIVCVHARHAW